jgi:hypothetical protein
MRGGHLPNATATAFAAAHFDLQFPVLTLPRDEMSGGFGAGLFRCNAVGQRIGHRGVLEPELRHEGPETPAGRHEPDP